MGRPLPPAQSSQSESAVTTLRSRHRQAAPASDRVADGNEPNRQGTLSSQVALSPFRPFLKPLRSLPASLSLLVSLALDCVSAFEDGWKAKGSRSVTGQSQSVRPRRTVESATPDTNGGPWDEGVWIGLSRPAAIVSRLCKPAFTRRVTIFSRPTSFNLTGSSCGFGKTVLDGTFHSQRVFSAANGRRARDSLRPATSCT